MNSVELEIGDILIKISGDYSLEYNDGKIMINGGLTQDSHIVEKTSKVPETKKVNTQPFYSQDKLRSGSQALYGLIEVWKKNFDLEDTEQPDRMKALTSAMMVHGDEIMTFLKYSKGLTTSILELFPPMPSADELQIIDHAKFHRRIACNIAQVSSVSMPELCDFLEPHANYLEQRFWW